MKSEKMMKVLYFLLAILLFAAGVVGLALPVVPQVPFFIAGGIFMMHASKKFKNRVKNSRLYREHGEKMIRNNKFLSKVMESMP